ncbi:hypothetical protein ACHWQZ_G017874 [Mnemiopsis leidyi]
MVNITEFYRHQHNKTADISLGVIYLLCCLLGAPLNALSLLYFTRQRSRKKDLPKILYTLTSLQDTFISLLSLNHGVTMLRYREVWLPGFCAAHHILFQMSQRMSVFLVAILSCTRTYIIVYPLKAIEPKSVLKLLAVLWVLMTCFFVIPPSIKLVQIKYHWESGYCWAEPIPGKKVSFTWDTIDNAMDTAGLAFPVIPITVSCIISAYKILTVQKVKEKRTQSKYSIRISSANIKSKNRKATGTIIIVTMMYIVSNIPLFVNYVLYLITIISFQYPGPIYSSSVMYFYSWNVTAILSTSLNAVANPVVYLTRFKAFRRWIRGGCLRGTNLSRQESTVRFSVVDSSLAFKAELHKVSVRNISRLKAIKQYEDVIVWKSDKTPGLMSEMVRLVNKMINKTEFEYRTVDVTIGTVYVFCFIFGVLCNTVSVGYFVKRRSRDPGLNNYLYILTATQDSVISLLSLNHGVTLLRYREVWLPGFCVAHHIIFQMSQRMSVFLVAALSVTRTYTLLFPLKKIKPKGVLLFLTVLWVLMASFFVIPACLKVVLIRYHWNNGYCWAEPHPEKNISHTWNEIDTWMDFIGLGCPIFPVTLSCIISSYKILSSRKCKQGLTKLGKSSQAAVSKTTNQITLTIILVTVLYITSNVPLCVNFFLWIMTIRVYREYPGPIYSSPVMFYYSWNVTALLSTALNAAANPVLYWVRFRKFREWFKQGLQPSSVTSSAGISTSKPHLNKCSVESKIVKTGKMKSSAV